MEIFAAGDIHGDQNLVKKLVQESKEADLVILCGDLTYFGKSSTNIIGPFIQAGKTAIILPGNHEDIATTDFLATYYNVKNLHGYSARYANIGFFGAGGSTEVGPSPKIANNEMFLLLDKAHSRISYLDKKIMITHEHPAESQIEKFTRFFRGSKAIRQAIDKFRPDILLCSHVHEAEGIEEKIGNTRIINVGKKGKRIIL